jgi:hypothetical protein
MKVFIYNILGYLTLWYYFNALLLKTPTNISEEHKHKISISQKSISEGREIFFKTSKPHRAQKDISEALEQFHSSKRFK